MANETILELTAQIDALKKQMDRLVDKRYELIVKDDNKRLAAYGLEKGQVVIVDSEIKDWFFRETSASQYRGWIDKPFMIGANAVISSSVDRGNDLHLLSDMWSMSFPVDMIIRAVNKHTANKK